MAAEPQANVPPPPPPPPPNANAMFDRLAADERLHAHVQQIRQQLRMTDAGADLLDDLIDSGANYESIAHLLLTAINGDAELPEQKVNIEYLRNDQKLIIPGILGMHIDAAGQGWCRHNATLHARYRKLVLLNYATLRSMITDPINSGTIRATVDAINVMAAPDAVPGWNNEAYPTLANGTRDTPENQNFVFATISAALQFNADFRDFGYLMTTDASLDDGAWKEAQSVTMARLRMKLKPYTQQQIAALNLPQVAGCEIAAWTRAYGLGIGMLPSIGSASQKEYIFVTRQATQENIKRINDYETEYERPLSAMCANILAMFGLLHLNKDHTYKTNDANMDRIGQSYIMTLRTDATSRMMDSLIANRESVIRTGPHPFGLGQTYWLARVLFCQGRLVAPLRVRINTTPPPIQRVMIVKAAALEWNAMPIGTVISGLYDGYLQVIAREATTIENDPPAYSGLHRLYGIAAQKYASEDALAAVTALMPCVYGYVEVTHTDGSGKRDGLGLALSLKNVERDSRGSVMVWKNGWENYLMAMDKDGLEQFVQRIMRHMAPPAAGGADRG